MPRTIKDFADKFTKYHIIETPFYIIENDDLISFRDNKEIREKLGDKDLEEFLRQGHKVALIATEKKQGQERKSIIVASFNQKKKRFEITLEGKVLFKTKSLEDWQYNQLGSELGYHFYTRDTQAIAERRQHKIGNALLSWVMENDDKTYKKHINNIDVKLVNDIDKYFDNKIHIFYSNHKEANETFSFMQFMQEHGEETKLTDFVKYIEKTIKRETAELYNKEIQEAIKASGYSFETIRQDVEKNRMAYIKEREIKFLNAIMEVMKEEHIYLNTDNIRFMVAEQENKKIRNIMINQILYEDFIDKFDKEGELISFKEKAKIGMIEALFNLDIDLNNIFAQQILLMARGHKREDILRQSLILVNDLKKKIEQDQYKRY